MPVLSSPSKKYFQLYRVLDLIIIRPIIIRRLLSQERICWIRGKMVTKKSKAQRRGFLSLFYTTMSSSLSSIAAKSNPKEGFESSTISSSSLISRLFLFQWAGNSSSVAIGNAWDLLSCFHSCFYLVFVCGFCWFDVNGFSFPIFGILSVLNAGLMSGCFGSDRNASLWFRFVMLWLCFLYFEARFFLTSDLEG